MATTLRLKRVRDQAIVLTGATSGIGLATARLAAREGARLVLVARNAEALEKLAGELRDLGTQAAAVPGDVDDKETHRRAAAAAQERFGGLDTWINDAGASAYGRLEQVRDEDHRRIFETNFWGTVYGSLEAVGALRQRGGGALINVGSVASDRAIPLQGMYSASKHAVKGFTDALRMELEEEGAPISVTLVKPTSIDTPFPHHAENYLESEPQVPPAVYAASVVAEAILHCAQRPTRDVLVGGGAKQISAMGKWAPRLTDKFMERKMFEGQKSGRPPIPARRALHEPGEGGHESGGHPGHVRRSSAYTKATLRPLLATAGVVMAGGLALAAAVALKDE